MQKNVPQQNDGQENSPQNNVEQKVKSGATKLVITVFAMFAFGFALVPLYDVFCDITGLNGKTADSATTYQAKTIDTTRLVTVQFISRIAQGAPWQFKPEMNSIKVHPGEMKFVKFYAKNESGKHAIGQAIPSVSPGLAANYFQKIECFCFNQQPLQASEDVWMPLQFYVDPELPADINELTLSYTLYDVTSKKDS